MRLWPALEIKAGRLKPAHPAVLEQGWDLVSAALVDFDVVAIDDNAADLWRVFFHTSVARDEAAAALARQFDHLAIIPVDVPDEDWAARSQASLKAVRVGNIFVAPPWDVGASLVEGRAGFGRPITIVIRPSMGFGTGHHATTRLCLAHLQQLELHGHTVIDVGTGSGVLAIAASRLGAMRVLAIDDDPDALQSARENLELNHGADVTLGVLDLRRARLKGFDLVLANLTGALLTAAATSLEALAAAGGRLILSGFLVDEEHHVLRAFASCSIEQRSQEDKWLCVTLSRSR